jgi:hypothetical protein
MISKCRLGFSGISGGSRSGDFISSRRGARKDGVATGDKTVSDAEAWRPGKVVTCARDIKGGLDVGHVVGAANQARLHARERARGGLDDLGHRQGFARADIVFAMRQPRCFQRRNDRLGDIIDIDIMIDEAGIAGDFGLDTALAIAY